MFVAIESHHIHCSSESEEDELFGGLDSAAKKAGALRFDWANVEEGYVDGSLVSLHPLSEATRVRFELHATRLLTMATYRYYGSENEAYR